MKHVYNVKCVGFQRLRRWQNVYYILDFVVTSCKRHKSKCWLLLFTCCWNTDIHRLSCLSKRYVVQSIPLPSVLLHAIRVFLEVVTCLYLLCVTQSASCLLVCFASITYTLCTVNIYIVVQKLTCAFLWKCFDLFLHCKRKNLLFIEWLLSVSLLRKVHNLPGTIVWYILFLNGSSEQFCNGYVICWWGEENSGN